MSPDASDLRQDKSAFPAQEGDGSPALGQIINDRYRIDSLLGKGGMCSVYKASEWGLDRKVAIKVMLPRFQADVKSFQRFQLEAKATSKLQHPNIAQIYSFGVHQQRSAYIVMEYIDGCSLADVLRQKGVLPIELTLEIILRVLEGLAEAHDKQIVHRDLKPSNIMIVGNKLDSPLVKIVDFGIAKIISEETSQQPQLTQTGDIFGSPLYMSPEQCRGQTVDRRSDLYSLGCVMYECLTGAPPFVGKSSIETIVKQTQEEPLSLKQATMGHEFPMALEGIVSKLLAKEPSNRYQSAPDLAYSLERFLQGHQPDLSGPAYSKGADFQADIGATKQERFQAINASLLAIKEDKPESESRFVINASLVALVVGIFLAVPVIWMLSMNPPAPPKSAPPTTPYPNDLVDTIFDKSTPIRNKYHKIDVQDRAEERLLDVSNNECELNLNDMTLSSDTGVKLAQLKKLQWLDMNDSHAPLEFFQSLSALPLRHLGIEHCKPKLEQLSCLKNIPTLIDLDAAHTEFSDDLVPVLNANLLALNLGDNRLTDAGLKALTTLLPNLHNLRVNNNQLSPACVDDLASMKQLRYLDISGKSNQFTQESVEKLRSALPHCVIHRGTYEVIKASERKGLNQ